MKMLKLLGVLCELGGKTLPPTRNVTFLPNHERALEFDDWRAVLVDAGRLDGDEADVRA